MRLRQNDKIADGDVKIHIVAEEIPAGHRAPADIVVITALRLALAELHVLRAYGNYHVSVLAYALGWQRADVAQRRAHDAAPVCKRAYGPGDEIRVAHEIGHKPVARELVERARGADLHDLTFIHDGDSGRRG